MKQNLGGEATRRADKRSKWTVLEVLDARRNAEAKREGHRRTGRSRAADAVGGASSRGQAIVDESGREQPSV